MPGAYSQHPNHYLAFVEAALCCAVLCCAVLCRAACTAMPFSDDHCNGCNVQLWQHHLFFGCRLELCKLPFACHVPIH